MDRDNNNSETETQAGLNLPVISGGLDSALSRGQTIPVEGTNVVRVPFGVRQARRIRPERPAHWATLVIPLQTLGDPTPPPAAA